MAEEKRPLTEQELVKIEAETVKLRAEAEQIASQRYGGAAKAEAEAKKADAEAKKADAEARKFNAEAAAAEATAYKAEIERSREEHKRNVVLTGDEFHHTYRLLGGINDDSCGKAMGQFTKWTRLVDNEPLTIDLIINSPGGGIFAGFALVDYIDKMHGDGHTVNITAYGMAASMGGVILQAGKTRLMGPSAHLLIHEASFSAGGTTGNVEDELELVHLLQDRILDMYAEGAARAAANGTATKPMTRRQLKSKWQRKDWWISAPDSLKYGFVDAIA